MNLKLIFVSVFYYLNLLCLIIVLSAHTLSFVSIGLFGLPIWGAISTFAGTILYMPSSIHISERLSEYYNNPSNGHLGRKNKGVGVINYRSTASITMPLSPGWLVALVQPAFLLFIPYTLVQAYFAIISNVEVTVGAARLIAPWILPALLYSLPVFLSWKRELSGKSNPRVIGHRQPFVINAELEDAYYQMADDEAREAEALDWIEGTIENVGDDHTLD
jgi:hypothetical protein